jgi:hypothetical protein
VTVDATTIDTFFTHPARDGGAKLSTFRVDYGVAADFAFVNGSTYEPRGGFVDVPVVREVQAVEVSAASFANEEQWVVATVHVTNEIQTVRTNVDGANEVQLITVMADAVQNAVQTVTTTAADYNAEQTITIDGTDVNEVQVLRTEVGAVYETQVLTVSATRVNERQNVTIMVRGAASTASANIGGSYQLTLDTRNCEWCSDQSKRTTASITTFTAAALQARLEALANIGAGNVEVHDTTSVDANGFVHLQFSVHFKGDNVRGDGAMLLPTYIYYSMLVRLMHAIFFSLMHVHSGIPPFFVVPPISMPDSAPAEDLHERPDEHVELGVCGGPVGYHGGRGQPAVGVVLPHVPLRVPHPPGLCRPDFEQQVRHPRAQYHQHHRGRRASRQRRHLPGSSSLHHHHRHTFRGTSAVPLRSPRSRA